MELNAISLCLTPDDLHRLVEKAVHSAECKGKIPQWLELDSELVEVEQGADAFVVLLTVGVLGKQVPLKLVLQPKADSLGRPSSVGFILREVNMFGAGSEDMADLIGRVACNFLVPFLDKLSVACDGMTFWVDIRRIAAKANVSLVGRVKEVELTASGLSVSIGE